MIHVLTLASALALLCAPAARAELVPNRSVVELDSIFGGHGDVIEVGSDDPLVMVRRYLEKKRDREALARYRFVENSQELELGAAVAGTICDHTAIRTVLAASEPRTEDESHRAVKRKLYAILHELHRNGAVFGYDGLARNACGASEPFLLVLDRAARAVYGLELKPCRL